MLERVRQPLEQASSTAPRVRRSRTSAVARAATKSSALNQPFSRRVPVRTPRGSTRCARQPRSSAAAGSRRLRPDLDEHGRRPSRASPACRRARRARDSPRRSSRPTAPARAADLAVDGRRLHPEGSPSANPASPSVENDGSFVVGNVQHRLAGTVSRRRARRRPRCRTGSARGSASSCVRARGFGSKASTRPRRAATAAWTE